MTGRRTYWHLEAAGRKPTEYDVGSEKLLYHPSRGFEVETSFSRWYERHGKQGVFGAHDWERFSDPRKTTYAKYVETRAATEAYVSGLFHDMARPEYRERLSASWVTSLATFLSALRFPFHGLQMVAAYLGQMAPSGKVAIACAFQAGDEMRRVQHVSRRLAGLAGDGSERLRLSDAGRARWHTEAAFQPFRELMERLLVTWDFGEALVATNLVVKPAFEAVALGQLSAAADGEGDPLFGRVLAVLAEDGAWHSEWAAAAVSSVLSEDAAAREKALQILWRVRTPTLEAVHALATAIGGRGGESASAAVDRALRAGVGGLGP